MQFAEVFLRLGSSLVAWMMLYAYILWLAVLGVIGCSADGDEMHRLLFGFGPFAAAFAFALRATRPFPEIHAILRWLAVPLFLLMPFALRTVWLAFDRAGRRSLALCADTAPATWEYLWAPLQALALGIVCFLTVRMWRSVSGTAIGGGS